MKLLPSEQVCSDRHMACLERIVGFAAAIELISSNFLLLKEQMQRKAFFSLSVLGYELCTEAEDLKTILHESYVRKHTTLDLESK